ncbi:cilia- and flagella-associated protein 276 [Toxorhynchites rutilus septentrionalis]|uniref:cilia- and flagella-associated protein 276 n=1 Tax=Toxorhynchites rutilus septentrionalis TaxID=329112 RepID=UPI0024790DB0|nr:cilia- and flagella-associated protein 276 [Toxorhynchites rutilus septentrionalis]
MWKSCSSIKRERNEDHIPNIGCEGCYLKELPAPPDSHPCMHWSAGLSPNERVFYHQTLSSARRAAKFVVLGPVPRDSLDVNLASKYNHSEELFRDKNDVVIQEETLGQDTFRRLRNTRDLSPEKIIPLKHPLQMGGLHEKASPNSVKLMNTGPHTPLTNPGYSRQTGDGNFFNY